MTLILDKMNVALKILFFKCCEETHRVNPVMILSSHIFVEK